MLQQLTLSTLLLTALPAPPGPQPGDPGGESAESIYGAALAQAGQVLQQTFQVIEGQPITPQDLYAHYADQLITAGVGISDGAAQAWDYLPDGHPMKSLLAAEFLGHGNHLAEAGAAIGSGMFDQAAISLQEFENEMVSMKLAGDAMHTYGHGVIRHACEDLALVCQGLGSGRDAQVSVMQEALDLAAAGSSAVTAAVSPMAEISDPQTLRLLGIDSEHERMEFLDLAQRLVDTGFLTVLETNGVTADQIVEGSGAFVITGRIHDLGRGLEAVGETIATCDEGEPSEDCPDLCTGDKDCAGCWASEVGMGKGNLNPDEYAGCGGWVAALVAAGHMPTGSDPFSVAVALFGAPGLPDALVSVVDLFRAVQLHDLSLWVKMTYECCEVEDCWDWYWFCPPLFENVPRNVCVRHETDWVKTPAGPVELLGAVQSRNAKTFKRIVGDFEKQFCKTACSDS